MEDKDNSIGATIKEMYGIAGELAISTDKATQTLGKQLRQLIEQLDQQITQGQRTAE